MRPRAKNPWIGKNYLDHDAKMAVPPAFWLQRLYDFDAELVVFPSRHVPYAYVLARKRRVASQTDRALATTITQPDTRFCLGHGLVPVTMIYRYSQASWSIDNILASLRRRDIWTHGGGDKMADALDGQEAAEDSANKQAVRDDMWARSGDAWASYNRRTGQRVSSPGMGSERHVPTAGSSSSTGGSGLVTRA